MATISWFSLCVVLLLLCPGSLGFDESILGSLRGTAWRQSKCNIDRLEALEPTRRVRSEAGVTEYFNENSKQIQCAGVTAFRRTLEPNGLLLPSFSNAPGLVYVLQGKGIMGNVIPGCPETFQSFQETWSEGRTGKGARQSESSRDEHQRITYFREGDIIALPAGVAHWCHNNGDRPLITITVLDTSSNANQLDQKHRQFMLAGGQRSGQQGKWQESPAGNNIFSGFDTDLLSQALGMSKEVISKIQSQEQKGEMVRVHRGFKVLKPSSRSERRWEREEEESEGSSESESESEREREREGGRSPNSPNGLDEAYCSARINENIGDPSLADVYTPQGGRYTTVNSQKLPVLKLVQMSADRLVLYKNAMLSPHWNINAHSIVYVTGGAARCQIVSNTGNTVFDGEVRRGQLLVIPQNYAVLTQAREDGFECVSFRTNSNAMINQIVGKASTIRGMPVDVLMNSFQISREDAQRLKYSRGNQMAIFAPKSTSSSSEGAYDA